MFAYIKKNWVIFVVLAICFWAIKPLFIPGFFPIHDDEQIARVFELDSALHDGQFPVRWVQHLGFGYGYPLFNFYPPLSYYAAQVFHSLGFSFIEGTKSVFLLSFFLSALFMYLWVKEHFGKIAGVFAAILYTYAPYHAVDIYVRGSMPSFVSYTLIPLSLLLLDKLFKEKKLNHSIFFGIVLGLIPLSHILKLFSFIPFLLIYGSYLLIERRNDIKRIFPLLILSLLIAFGLTAFFLIPAALEKNYTMVDKINTGELFNYRLHFVCLKQFFESPWGYGGSLPNCQSGLSFEVGKIHLLTFFLAVLFLAKSFFIKKFSKFKFPTFIIFLFLLSLYMANSHSSWIWERVQFLSYLQFPWRFLTLSAALSSFVGGFVIYYIEKNFGKKIALSLLIFLGFLAIFIVRSDFQPQRYLNVGDSYYTNLDDVEWRVSKSSFEFVPKGVATKLSDIKTTQIDIEKNEIQRSSYKIVRGEAGVKVISDKSQLKIFETDSKTNFVLQINTFSFPGWKILADGKEIKYRDDNKLKLITVDVPTGHHSLTASFTNTLPRAVGNAITLVTIFNLIGFGLFKIRRTP